MGPNEVARLLTVASNVWPAMRLEEHTVEAWAMVLDDVPYHDAAEALRVIARTQYHPPAVADVMREVRRTWDRRESEGHPNEIVPNVDPGDPAAFAAEVGAIRRAVRRGNFDRETYALGGTTLTGAPALPPRPRALERRPNLRAAMHAAGDRLADA